jgi:hypothetical protein
MIQQLQTQDQQQNIQQLITSSIHDAFKEFPSLHNNQSQDVPLPPPSPRQPASKRKDASTPTRSPTNDNSNMEMDPNQSYDASI